MRIPESTHSRIIHAGNQRRRITICFVFLEFLFGWIPDVPVITLGHKLCLLISLSNCNLKEQKLSTKLSVTLCAYQVSCWHNVSARSGVYPHGKLPASWLCTHTQSAQLLPINYTDACRSRSPSHVSDYNLEDIILLQQEWYIDCLKRVEFQPVVYLWQAI